MHSTNAAKFVFLFRFPLHSEHGDMALASGSCAGAHLRSSDDSHHLEVRLANETCIVSCTGLLQALCLNLIMAIGEYSAWACTKWYNAS